MLDHNEIIKKTRLFGLNAYEAKIWTSILSRNIATAGELSDMANVPRSRSYDVLESLEKKGFVIIEQGKPVKYLAVPPKEVLENVKKKIELAADKRLMDIKNNQFNILINTFQKIYEGSINESQDMVAVLKGRGNIYKHLGFLFSNSKKDILCSEDVTNVEDPEIFNDLKNKMKIITKNLSFGIRMGVVDGNNTLIFPIKSEETHPDYDLCIWIKNEQTTKFMRDLLVFAL